MNIKQIMKILKYCKENEGHAFPYVILFPDYSGQFIGGNWGDVSTVEEELFVYFDDEKEFNELYNKIMKG